MSIKIDNKYTTIVEKFVVGQYRRPGAVIGDILAGGMIHKHKQENAWTVMLLHPQPTDKILELGFGPGAAIQRLSTYVTEGHVSGVDISEAMLRSAKRRNAQAIKEGRVDLSCSDVMKLPYNGGIFDKAFSVHSLYFWQNPLVAIKEIRRVLRPGGFLVLTITPKERWPEEVLEPGTLLYSADDASRLLYQAGFRSVRVEYGPAMKQFPWIAIIGINI